ncbi:hypothetical protein ACT7DZ_06300 [Bacillus cereus]
MDGLSIQIFTEQIAKYYYEMHNENEEGEIKKFICSIPDQ